MSLNVGGQPSGPYIVEHDDSTQQGAGIFGWFAGSNFMNKVVEKTKVCSSPCCVVDCVFLLAEFRHHLVATLFCQLASKLFGSFRDLSHLEMQC